MKTVALFSRFLLLACATVLMTGLGMILRPPTAQAATYTWNGVGSWNDTSRWTPSGVPGPGDTVVINYGNATVSTNVTVGNLRLSGGSLLGTGTMTVTGTLDWEAGGLVAPLTVIIPAGAVLNIPPGGTRDLSGTLNNSGTVNWRGTIIGTSQGAATVNNSGTFNDSGDSSFTTHGTFNNTGTYTKIGSATSSFGWDWTFNNNGTVNVNSGTLQLAGPGASNGAFVVSGLGSFLEFAPSAYLSHTLASGSSVSGNGTVRFNGSTTIVNGSYNVTGTTELKNYSSVEFNNAATTKDLTFDNQGTLGGTGTLTITGVANWTAGYMMGTGTTVIAAGGTLNISGGDNKYLGRTLTNQGYINWSGTGEFGGYAGGVLNNNAVFNDAGGHKFAPYTGVSAFNNTAEYNKSGANTTTFDYDWVFPDRRETFNNSGTANVNEGTISLKGGGNNTGAFVIAADAVLEFTTGDYTLGAGASITGAGTARLAGGTLTVTGSRTVSNLNLVGGTLTGTGELTVTGTLNWTGGTMGGTGSTSIAIGGTLNASGDNAKTLNTRTLNNAGTVYWTGYGAIAGANGAVINNTGAFNDSNTISHSLTSTGTAATFNNTGTYNKSNSGWSTSNMIFNNNGTVNVNGGKLTLTAGTSGGSFVAATGGILQFGGAHTLNSASSITGAGTVVFWATSATVTVSGTYNVTGSTEISGGTVDFTVNVYTKDLRLSSNTLTGAGTVTVGGTLTWIGGTMSGTGSTVIPAGAVLEISGSSTKYLNTRTLTNNGTVNWTGSGWLSGTNGALFDNRGVFNDTPSTSGHSFTWPDVSPPAPFGNSGTYNKNGTATSALLLSFNNTGTVNVKAGTLVLKGGGDTGGAFAVAASSTLEVSHWSTGSFGFGPASSISGATTPVTISGTFAPDFTEISAATVDFTGTATTTNLTLSDNGTLRGAGTVTLRPGGTLTWNWGAMSGTGATLVPGGGALEIGSDSPKNLDGRTLTNAGTANWTGFGNLTASNGAVFNNSGTFNDSNTSGHNFILGAGAAPAFNNTGTFTKTTAGYSSFFVPFTSTGTVTVSAGNLNLAGGGTGSGAFSPAVDGILEFSGGTYSLASGSSVTGAGKALFSGGVTTVNGTYNITGTTEITGGTASFTGSASTKDLTLSGGALTGAGTVTLSGTSTWTGGTMGGSGSTAIAAGGILNISGDTAKNLDGRALNTGGTANWTGNGAIAGSGGALLTNSGAFNDGGAHSLSGAPFFNTGSYRKTGQGVSTFGGRFDNRGTVDVQNGTVTVTGSYTQITGSTLVAGTLGANPGIQIRDGSLGGAGTLNGNVSNAGNVNPGASAGAMTINGNYVQAPAGALNLEIGGTVPGTQYDKLVISGTATLDGTLNVSLIDSFAPSVGNTFQVMTFASRNGDFTAWNVPQPGNVALVIGYLTDTFYISAASIAPTPSPTVTVVPTPTPSPTPAGTATPTPAATSTPTPTPTPSPTPAPTPTPSPSPSPSPTPATTATPTPAATSTPTPTPSPSPSPSPTPTPAPTSTATPTPAPTVAPGDKVIEAAITQDLDTGGRVVFKVNISRVKLVSSGADTAVSGGLGSFAAHLTYNAAGLTVMNVRENAPFSPFVPSLNIEGGSKTTFATSQSGSTPQAPVTVAYVVPSLTGSKDVAYDATLTFTSVSGGSGEVISPGTAVTVGNLMRGNVRDNDTVTISDALFIAQYLAGLRSLGTGANAVNHLNAASVKRDTGTGGEQITIADALLIAQMLAGLRDASFN